MSIESVDKGARLVFSRTLCLSKKPSSKNYKPECDNSEQIAKHWTKRKNFNEEDLRMLRAGGYTIIIEKIKPDPKKSKSTINLPHISVYYDKEQQQWIGQWFDPKTGQPCADLITQKTKKRVLEALITQEITIRNKDLKNS